MGISKTRRLFPSEENPAQVFRLRSPQKRNHARFAFKWFSQCPSWPVDLFFLSWNFWCGPEKM